jgi:hypothetical protein
MQVALLILMPYIGPVNALAGRYKLHEVGVLQLELGSELSGPEEALGLEYPPKLR